MRQRPGALTSGATASSDRGKRLGFGQRCTELENAMKITTGITLQRDDRPTSYPKEAFDRPCLATHLCSPADEHRVDLTSTTMTARCQPQARLWRGEHPS